MGKVIMSGVVPPLSEPITGILLATIAEGSTVYLNENGNPVEFYVACHNYEESLNGMGRTLLVRKDCYDERIFNTTENETKNVFQDSTIDVWLNTNYLGLLDERAKSAIEETCFVYTHHDPNEDDTFHVTTLTRPVFLLSLYEYGKSTSYSEKEGSTLSIASTLRIAKYNGTAVKHWTRSPNTANRGNMYCLSASGGSTSGNVSTGTTAYSRPCFTLPSNARFDEETLIFKGVR